MPGEELVQAEVIHGNRGADASNEFRRQRVDIRRQRVDKGFQQRVAGDNLQLCVTPFFANIILVAVVDLHPYRIGDRAVRNQIGFVDFGLVDTRIVDR